MNIGDSVIYNGSAYLLRGLDPMSMPDRRAVLEHAETGEVVHAPLDEILPSDVTGESAA
jgi:hypothetical protein